MDSGLRQNDEARANVTMRDLGWLLKSMYGPTDDGARARIAAHELE